VSRLKKVGDGKESCNIFSDEQLKISDRGDYGCPQLQRCPWIPQNGSFSASNFVSGKNPTGLNCGGQVGKCPLPKRHCCMYLCIKHFQLRIFTGWSKKTDTCHKFLLVTVKEWLKSVLNCRSYSKNKTGYPFFWTTLYFRHVQAILALYTFSSVHTLFLILHACRGGGISNTVP